MMTNIILFLLVASLYNSYDYFTCLDGEKYINVENINDSVCDCRDGSDEPGEHCLEHYLIDDGPEDTLPKKMPAQPIYLSPHLYVPPFLYS